MGDKGVKLFIRTFSEKPLLERTLLEGNIALILSSDDWLLMSLGPPGELWSSCAFLLVEVALKGDGVACFGGMCIPSADWGWGLGWRMCSGLV
jgi:hypothetical protein